MTSSSSREDVKSLVICEDSAALETKTAARSKFRQHVAAILANLATLCIGMANAWTAPALPLIQRQTDVVLPLYATDEEASWISSLLPIGAVVGALPAGFLADRLGRRRVLLMMAIPYFLGWMLIVLAEDSILQVYVGRLITGLAGGSSMVLVPLYNEEIAEDSIRGSLGVYFNFILYTGILFMYIIGALLPYMSFTILCSVVPIIFAVTFFWMPESPSYLVSKNLIPEAEKSLMWLRNSSLLNDKDIQPEIQRLVARSKESTDVRLALWNRTSIKAVAIVFGLMFFQQLTGISAVIFYTVQIFNDAGSSLPGAVSSVIMGFVQLIALLIPTFLVDKVGRRPLLIISATLTAVCLGILSGYFYFKMNGYDVESWRWLPLITLVTYAGSVSIGLAPLPFFMMAELVPTAVKGKLSSAAIALNRGLTVFVTKLFPMMVLSVGQSVTFGTLCGITTLGIIFVVFSVPETKGRSREEIRAILENNMLF